MSVLIQASNREAGDALHQDPVPAVALRGCGRLAARTPETVADGADEEAHITRATDVPRKVVGDAGRETGNGRRGRRTSCRKGRKERKAIKRKGEWFNALFTKTSPTH